MSEKLITGALLLLVAGSVSAEDPFEGGTEIDSFHIICDTSSHTQHFRFKDGNYMEFTVAIRSGEKTINFSARPSKVRLAHLENSFDDGYSVEWSQFVIGIDDSAQITKSGLASPELMTLVISTENNPGYNRWSSINIEKQEAFIGPNGYLSWATNSKKEKRDCSLDR